ncbi:MAG: hypothetical protein AAF721_31265 [Myxococcota bacterium]
MGVRCSQCHTEFTLESEGAGDEHGACPTCGAEAGLEPVKAVPPAMRAFGTVLGTVIVVAVVGDLISRIVG